MVIPPPAEVVVDLVLLQLEMKVDAVLLRMIEDDLPLVELLEHVIVKLVVTGGKGPHVIAIAAGVVGKERN